MKYFPVSGRNMDGTASVTVSTPGCNGNGAANILWKHSTSGIIYIWLMGGYDIGQFGYVYTMSDNDRQTIR